MHHLRWGHLLAIRSLEVLAFRTSLKSNKRGPGGPRYSRPGGWRYIFMRGGSETPVRE